MQSSADTFFILIRLSSEFGVYNCREETMVGAILFYNKKLYLPFQAYVMGVTYDALICLIDVIQSFYSARLLPRKTIVSLIIMNNFLAGWFREIILVEFDFGGNEANQRICVPRWFYSICSAGANKLLLRFDVLCSTHDHTVCLFSRLLGFSQELYVITFCSGENMIQGGLFPYILTRR